MSTVIGDLGNASGMIYITDTDGTSVLSSVVNSQDSVRRMLADAGFSNPVADTGEYSTVFGRRYFLNSDSMAAEGVLTSSLEITDYVVMKGLQGVFPTDSYTIAGGVLTATRKASIINVNVETQGGAGTDDLDTITTTGFITGDIIIFRGLNAAHVVTFKNLTGNMTLSNATAFASGNKINSIALQYISGSGWFEILRTPNPLISVAAMRAVGIPQPISGVNKTTLGNGGGTINIEPGVDKGIQVYDGTVTLAGSYVIQIQPSPGTAYLDGDTMFVEYRALATVGSNTVTIFGITLTTEQALEGRVYLKAEYKLSNTTWYYDIFYSAFGVDVENKAHTAATYEPILGNPAGNGYILTSTTGGVRSWIPNPATSGNLWETGSGTGSLQTKDNGADASGDNSFAAGVNAAASGNGSVSIGLNNIASTLRSTAVGNNSNATGSQSMALGDTCVSSADGAIALGGVQAQAVGVNSNAIGSYSKASVSTTTNISGAIITKKTTSVLFSSYFQEGASAQVTISTELIDLKSGSEADYSITLPTGCTFYCDSVDLIISTASATASVAPTISVGKTGTLDFLVPVVLTTVKALRNRDKFEVATDVGISGTDLTASVTTGATSAGTIKGRFVFKGFLMEDE